MTRERIGYHIQYTWAYVWRFFVYAVVFLIGGWMAAESYFWLIGKPLTSVDAALGAFFLAIGCIAINGAEKVMGK